MLILKLLIVLYGIAYDESGQLQDDAEMSRESAFIIYFFYHTGSTDLNKTEYSFVLRNQTDNFSGFVTENEFTNQSGVTFHFFLLF